MLDKVPVAFLEMVNAGKVERQQEKDNRQAQIRADLERKKSDDELKRKKRWGFLCVEARIDLGPKLSEYVDWKEPPNWTGQNEVQWLYIRIPGFSVIVAEYRRYGTCEWYHDRWGVSCYDKGISSWLSFNKQDKSVEYILAFAREQFLSRTVEETKEKPKSKEPQIAEVKVEEVDETHHQAVS